MGDGQKVLMVWWGVSEENGDALAVLEAGKSGCESLELVQQNLGDHGEQWVVEKRSDGTTGWHNTRYVSGLRFAAPEEG